MSNTMIFGQISPVISLAQQTDLFDQTTSYITGSYIAAVANQYALGCNQVNFRVMYGNCTFESGSVTTFQTVYATNVVLSGSTITTWGEDDSIILDALANEQGTNVIAVVSGSTNNMFLG
jgi:hypothetical protein